MHSSKTSTKQTDVVPSIHIGSKYHGNKKVSQMAKKIQMKVMSLIN